VVMAFASLFPAPATASECVSVHIDASQLLHDSALVFAGTLVEGDQYTLTFKPDRVWKGQPSERATVYVVGYPFVGAFSFQPGRRYLIAARVLQQEERQSINIDDRAPVAFGFQRPCGSPLPLSLLPELDRLARRREADRRPAPPTHADW
jgi:hypothetical protein